MVGRTSWWRRLSPRRRAVIAVTLVVLFLVAAAVGSALSHHGTPRQCVETRSLKVADPALCQHGGSGSAEGYRWYYGSAVTQVGGTARGGSFSDPDEQGSGNQNGSGTDDDGGDDDSGSSGGGGADDG
jgi:uncharacterized membrane protein YgcG